MYAFSIKTICVLVWTKGQNCVEIYALMYTGPFSNSLIIYEEKTKEITAVKEVCKCELSYDKI